MTVTYVQWVRASDFAGFGKHLIRWKGGIYRLVYREFLVYVISYYLVLVLYRFGLSDVQQRVFETFATYCRRVLNLIPITFAMGFYINLIIQRWWTQFMNLPWVDSTCVLIGTYVEGSTLHARMIRRNLARYLSAIEVLTFTMVSPTVRRRFPTLDHVVDAEERDILVKWPSRHGQYYYPCQWFGALVTKARQENLIKDDNHVVHLIKVVSIANYFFFAGSLFGRQYLLHDQARSVNKYVPIFTLLQFVFYMGWLKCAHELINPLGDDDEDFEINYLIDRNLEVGYTMVDDLAADLPLQLMENPVYPNGLCLQVDPPSKTDESSNNHVSHQNDNFLKPTGVPTEAQILNPNILSAYLPKARNVVPTQDQQLQTDPSNTSPQSSMSPPLHHRSLGSFRSRKKPLTIL